MYRTFPKHNDILNKVMEGRALSHKNKKETDFANLIKGDI